MAKEIIKIPIPNTTRELIDHAQGEGYFGIAMQELGGKCVFHEVKGLHYEKESQLDGR